MPMDKCLLLYLTKNLKIIHPSGHTEGDEGLCRPKW